MVVLKNVDDEGLLPLHLVNHDLLYNYILGRRRFVRCDCFVHINFLNLDLAF